MLRNILEKIPSVLTISEVSSPNLICCGRSCSNKNLNRSQCLLRRSCSLSSSNKHQLDKKTRCSTAAERRFGKHHTRSHDFESEVPRCFKIDVSKLDAAKSRKNTGTINSIFNQDNRKRKETKSIQQQPLSNESVSLNSQSAFVPNNSHKSFTHISVRDQNHLGRDVFQKLKLDDIKCNVMNFCDLAGHQITEHDTSLENSNADRSFESPGLVQKIDSSKKPDMNMAREGILPRLNLRRLKFPKEHILPCYSDYLKKNSSFTTEIEKRYKSNYLPVSNISQNTCVQKRNFSSLSNNNQTSMSKHNGNNLLSDYTNIRKTKRHILSKNVHNLSCNSSSSLKPAYTIRPYIVCPAYSEYLKTETKQKSYTQEKPNNRDLLLKPVKSEIIKRNSSARPCCPDYPPDTCDQQTPRPNKFLPTVAKVRLPSAVKCGKPPKPCPIPPGCPPRADDTLEVCPKKLPILQDPPCVCIEPHVPERSPQLKRLKFRFTDQPRICPPPYCPQPRADDLLKEPCPKVLPLMKPKPCDCIEPPPMVDVPLKRLKKICVPEEICYPPKPCPPPPPCLRADDNLCVYPKKLPILDSSICPCIEDSVKDCPPLKRLDLTCEEPKRVCPKPCICGVNICRADDCLVPRRKKLPRIVPGECSCIETEMVDVNFKPLVCREDPDDWIGDPCDIPQPRADYGCWEYYVPEPPPPKKPEEIKIISTKPKRKPKTKKVYSRPR